jgi:hypothetical protein
MDVSHKPIEDVDVAVHTDINIVSTLGIREVLLEIFHIGDQELFVTFEVLVELFVLIANVNDDGCSTGYEGWWTCWCRCSLC